MEQNFQKMLERANDLGITLYQSSTAIDCTLVRWWEHLNQTGDFDLIFTDRLRPLAHFMSNFQPPNIAFFGQDHEPPYDIWLAVWFAPFSDTNSGVFMHYWCDKPKRGTPLHLQATHLVYDIATQCWPVIVGITRHEHLLGLHRKLGYNIVGQIPQMLDGQDVWVLYLTRELFLNSRVYKTGERYGQR